jgi:hypothetical protein
MLEKQALPQEMWRQIFAVPEFAGGEIARLLLRQDYSIAGIVFWHSLRFTGTASAR